MHDPSSKSLVSGRVYRFVEKTLLFVAGVFLLLHFRHLAADFPNNSPWMDWSKYTDEGWYGDGAIRHFQRGSWYVPGDFNPAAALPVWPLLEGVVFRFTGVSLVAARALTVCVFAGIMVVSYLLVRRRQTEPASSDSATQLSLPCIDSSIENENHRKLAAALGVALLAVSPFCFAFMRIAILEPILILLTLLALHAAYGAFERRQGLPGGADMAPRLISILTLGFLIPAMILTKTTAVFLLPSVVFLLWASAGYHIRTFFRAAVPVALLAATLWSAYFFFVVSPHFLTDYRYLFSANAYTGIKLTTAFMVLHDTVRDGIWIGKLLYPLSVIAILVVILRPRRLARQSLPIALILWALGYTSFLAYHNNLQPRYYLVIAVPLTLLTALVCEPALRGFDTTWNSSHLARAGSIFAGAVTLLFGAIIFLDARETLRFVEEPEYTFVQAAYSIRRVVTSDRGHSSLVLSISGSDLSLITGLPSICDDFGTLELADRVKQYRPGWYAAWNQIDDDKMDALTPLYRPVRVAAFPAMDDPARNLLILYRLDPKPATLGTRSRRQPVPQPLQTKLGQQPSVTQLEH